MCTSFLKSGIHCNVVTADAELLNGSFSCAVKVYWRLNLLHSGG